MDVSVCKYVCECVCVYVCVCVCEDKSNKIIKTPPCCSTGLWVFRKTLQVHSMTLDTGVWRILHRVFLSQSFRKLVESNAGAHFKKGVWKKTEQQHKINKTEINIRGGKALEKNKAKNITWRLSRISNSPLIALVTKQGE